MITRTSNILWRQQPRSLLQRYFSVKAIHSSFPATLHYCSSRRRSSLFDHRENNNSRPDNLYDEGVTVDENGLVYPGISARSVSNGAVMLPNTFMMQELVRRYCDEVLDCEDKCGQVEMPFIYTIPKGTAIPSHLILLNEYVSRFSLQPSQGMLLSDLNQLLDNFYNKNAKKETVDNWLDAHPFQDAACDDADAVWMAK